MVFPRISRKRLARASNLFATCPIPDEAVEEAFLGFKYEGELPEDERFAAAVCAKAGYQNIPSTPDDLATAIALELLRAKMRKEMRI